MNIIGVSSNVWEFQICTNVPKGTPTRYAHLVGGTSLVFSSPVDLQPYDHVWIDTRNGSIEVVQRFGVSLWRAGWVN